MNGDSSTTAATAVPTRAGRPALADYDATGAHALATQPGLAPAALAYAADGHAR